MSLFSRSIHVFIFRNESFDPYLSICSCSSCIGDVREDVHIREGRSSVCLFVHSPVAKHGGKLLKCSIYLFQYLRHEL